MQFHIFNTMEELLAMEIIEMFPFTPSPFSLRQVVFGCLSFSTVSFTVYHKYIVFTVYTEIERRGESTCGKVTTNGVYIIVGDASLLPY